MNKFIPCNKCKNSTIEGHIVISLNIQESKVMSVKECPCHIKWRNGELTLVHMKKYNIPLWVRNINFHSYLGTQSKRQIKKLQKYIKKFDEIGKYKCLYIYGGNGNQKTTMIHVLAKELIIKGFMAYYVSTMDYLIKQVSKFDNQKDDNTLLFEENITKADLLIIDECFSRKYSTSVSDYQLSHLRTFLKERIEVQGKAIIFVSNNAPDEISSQGFTQTIQDLIVRNTIDKVLHFNDNYIAEKNYFKEDELWK